MMQKHLLEIKKKKKKEKSLWKHVTCGRFGSWKWRAKLSLLNISVGRADLEVVKKYIFSFVPSTASCGSAQLVPGEAGFRLFFFGAVVPSTSESDPLVCYKKNEKKPCSIKWKQVKARETFLNWGLFWCGCKHKLLWQQGEQQLSVVPLESSLGYSSVHDCFACQVMSSGKPGSSSAEI